MRQLVALLALGGIVTFGVVVGTRMSSDAIAVLVGVIAGVGASIPCALLLMAVTRGNETARRKPHDEDRLGGRRYQDSQFGEPADLRRSVPPIVVVTPASGAVPQLPYAAPQPYSLPLPRSERQFRVMGYEESEPQSAEVSPEAPLWRE